MTDKEKAIVMAYTKIAMLTGKKLNIFYEYINKLLGRPIYSHELANKAVWEEIKKASRKDFVHLCSEESKAIPIEWIEKWVVTNNVGAGRTIDRLLEDWEKENEQERVNTKL